jgi:hypothetical protein
MANYLGNCQNCGEQKPCLCRQDTEASQSLAERLKSAKELLDESGPEWLAVEEAILALTSTVEASDEVPGEANGALPVDMLLYLPEVRHSACGLAR